MVLFLFNANNSAVPQLINFCKQLPSSNFAKVLHLSDQLLLLAELDYLESRPPLMGIIFTYNTVDALISL